MRKALLIAVFIAAGAPFALAQNDGSTYHRGEFGVLYSANWVDDDGAFSASGDDRTLFHGLEVNGGYNFSRYFGIQGAVTHNRKENTISGGGFTTDVDGKLTQVLGGLKVQDNSTETVVKPYARALFGLGQAKVDVTSNIPGVTGSDDDTGFAAILGGGLDFRLGKHVDLTTSLDYNPVRLRGDLPGSGDEFTHNLRAGVGLKFRWGAK